MGMDRQIKKQSWLRKNYILVIVGTAFLVFILATTVFGDHRSTFKVDMDKLSVGEVVRDTFQDYISITGVAEPIRTVSLHPLVGGQVKEKLHEEGDEVKAGDIILTMTNPELEQSIIDMRSELDQERINVQQSKINEEKNRAGFKSQIMEIEFSVNNERRNYEEKKYEYEQGMIPQNAFLMAKESYEFTLKKRDIQIENLHRDSLLSVLNIKRMENNLERNEAKFRIEQRKLDDLNVKAPVAGRLSSLINVEIGGQLGKNSGIGYIRDLSELKILANIDQYYTGRVSRHLQATCSIENKDYDLYVDKVSFEVNGGRFETELLFTDHMPDLIRVGQTYHIKLRLGDSQVGILIPRGGFFQSTGGRWIYVIDKSNSFAEKRVIRLGSKNDDYYEVLEGLEPGEKVIVSGYDTFGDAEKLVFK
ncbi:efflux RND transporter periplasmic adaptor subunit [Saccharicrinis sp. FJH2]